MTSHGTMSDTDEVFFSFLFLASPSSLGSKDCQVVGIPRVALDAVPDSLLSTLKETRWKAKGKEQGKKSNPIPVKIYKAPCKEGWNRNMAHWIRDVYAWHLDNCRIALPEATELEDALIVLDYLGLAPDNPRDITVESASRIVQIRAAMYLRNINAIETAKDFVLDNLVNDPCRKKFFMFCGSEHQLCHIKESNFKKGTTPIAHLLGEEGCDSDRNLEWVENESLRMRFLTELEDEGLKVRFLSGLEFSEVLRGLVKKYTFVKLSYGSMQCDKCGELGHYLRDCPKSDWRYQLKYGAVPKDKCWVNFKRSTFQLEYVVQVEVPVANNKMNASRAI